MSDGRAWPGYSGSLSLHTGETETLLHRVISRYHRVPHYPFRVMDCVSIYRIIGINLELHKLVNSTNLFIQFKRWIRDLLHWVITSQVKSHYVVWVGEPD